jgi:hypothetical protein
MMFVVDDIVVSLTLQYSSFTGKNARFFDELNFKSSETTWEAGMLGALLTWRGLARIADVQALLVAEGSSDMPLVWMRVYMRPRNDSAGMTMCTGEST